MDRIQWERLKNAFFAAISRGQTELSDALIDACKGDDELMSELRPLVEEHFRLLSAGRTRQSKDTIPVEPDCVVAGRFKVLALLGSGAFGDVYRVYDQTVKAEFALKILRSSNPVALHYFKREFRVIKEKEIHHRNIVVPHKLFTDDDRWMFSMEFVDGIDFRRFVCSQPIADRDEILRSCVLQIADGLLELHEKKLLHRDLKPSNALVTVKGRVVLLDFGLVHALGVDSEASSTTIAGTPDYMSPEQAAGDSLTEASDWYALGVMLYEALTGVRPFQGAYDDVLRNKQFEVPVPPVRLAGIFPVPPQLNELCVGLLERDPLKRASYAEVRLLLDQSDVQIKKATRPVLVGRREPLGRLSEAYDMADGSPVLVHLCGTSGIGKTLLIREFLNRLRVETAALIFAGRCFASESVPYHAVDDLVDHIYQYLRRCPRDHVERLLPRNFLALVKVFPGLAQFLPRDIRPLGDFDATKLRTQAFGALREMLGRFAERSRLVLVVDDLQWGDVDGSAALNDLLSSSDLPPMLVVLAYRSEDIEASASLKALRETDGRSSILKTIFIDLNHLEPTDIEELAQSVLEHPASKTTLQRVVGESGGNPFLVHEIVRWINLRGADGALAAPFSLDDVVRSRINQLGEESRHFLESIAVAGQPTELPILQLAGRIVNVEAARDEALAARFVRSRRVEQREEVEIYHDRIRDAILTDMDEGAIVQRHLQLARALESAGAHDPERLATHFRQSHDLPSTCKYALQAARRSVDVLAFNKAARFFEIALSTDTLQPADRRMANRECADALANAGRGEEAAKHYLAACLGATVDEQLEWKQRAADELVRSGYVDRGLEIFAEVLAQVGTRIPRPTSRWPLDLLVRRARLRLRGLRWQERDPSSVPRDLLLRLDTCASVSTGLALVDVARGAALQTTSLLLALKAGEPTRIAKAMAMEAGFRSTAGVKTERRFAPLLRLAQQLSERTGDPGAIGLTAVMAASCAWSIGQWEECYRRARFARDILQERPERLTWERDTAAIFEVDGLRWMGKWSAMKAILPEFLEDARQRGDLYAESILQMHCGSCAELANDRPDLARKGLGVLERWSNSGFHVEHLIETHNQVEIDLYMGLGKRAFEQINRRWPLLRRSLLLRVQNFNIEMRSLFARACLGAASDEPSGRTRADLLKMAARESLVIKREGSPQGMLLGELIDGSIHVLSGNHEKAIAAFKRAETVSIFAGMSLHCAVARLSQGVLMGHHAGRELRSAAVDKFTTECIVNPERMAAVIVPWVSSKSSTP